MFGYELSEVIGMHAEKLANPGTWKVIKENISKESDRSYEGIGVRKDGSTFVCSLIGKPYKFKDRILRVIILRDITEHKRIEEKLQFEEQQFRVLAEQSLDIIVLMNREGIVSYTNPAIERILGFKAEERIGSSGFDLIHPDDLKAAADNFNILATNTNSPVLQGEMRYHNKN